VKSYCKGLVLDRESVERGYARWRSGESGSKNEYRVYEEYGTPDALVEEIASEIASRTLSFRPIHRYPRRESTNGKLRIIGVESVKQQVCDYVADAALASLIDARVGYWQVASVRGKGQLMLVEACQRWCREYAYHVHVDIRKCYPSIKVDVVRRILRKYVRSDDVLYLCGSLLDTYDGSLEIGSYFSLRMAQLVLSFGYHFLEDVHKGRRGRRVRLIGAQGWYADDGFVFGDCKRDLEMAVRRLERFYAEGFSLSLKGWKVSRCGDDEPVRALGFTVRPDRVTVKDDLYLRIRAAFRDFERHPTEAGARRVTSYWGYLEHSDSMKAIEAHGYLGTVKRARRLVSAVDRKRRERQSHGHHD
jgi:RNA-directed DNA polymerase